MPCASRAKAPAGTRIRDPGRRAGRRARRHCFWPAAGSATSLVSRRSQLRAARLDLAVLDQQITDAQRETAHLKREIERHEQARADCSKPASRSTKRLPPTAAAGAIVWHSGCSRLGSNTEPRTRQALADDSETCAGDRRRPSNQPSQELGEAQAAGRCNSGRRSPGKTMRAGQFRIAAAAGRERGHGRQSRAWPAASSGWKACDCG